MKIDLEVPGGATEAEVAVIPAARGEARTPAGLVVPGRDVAGGDRPRYSPAERAAIAAAVGRGQR
jgi:hypothetical protein